MKKLLMLLILCTTGIIASEEMKKQEGNVSYAAIFIINRSENTKKYTEKWNNKFMEWIRLTGKGSNLTKKEQSDKDKLEKEIIKEYNKVK